VPTFPTSATREVRSGDNCDLNGQNSWPKFAGGHNPDLLRSLRALRSAMETNLNVLSQKSIEAGVPGVPGAPGAPGVDSLDASRFLIALLHIVYNIRTQGVSDLRGNYTK